MAPECAIEAMPEDVIRQRIQRGEPTYTLAIRAFNTVEIVHAAAASGHHAIYVDLQHGSASVADAAQLCQAARALGLAALVRVPLQESTLISRVLDNGACGVLLPDIETADQAARAVQQALFPPAGRRSQGGARGFAAPQSPAFVGAMIESTAAGVNAAAIAAVPGVDALVIGAADLAASLDRTGAFDDPDVVRAIESIIGAAQRVGRPVAVAGLRSPEACARFVRKGAAPWFFLGTDIVCFLDGARRQVASFDAVVRNAPRKSEVETPTPER